VAENLKQNGRRGGEPAERNTEAGGGGVVGGLTHRYGNPGTSRFLGEKSRGKGEPVMGSFRGFAGKPWIRKICKQKKGVGAASGTGLKKKGGVSRGRRLGARKKVNSKGGGEGHLKKITPGNSTQREWAKSTSSAKRGGAQEWRNL